MSKIAKIIIGIVIVIIIIALVIAFLPKQERGVIKIGVILPLTGGGSFFGEEAKNGINLAIEKVDSGLEVIFEDSRTDPKGAVDAANKLISQDEVKILISWMSSLSSVVAPIADENKTVLIYGSTVNDPALSYEYVFKNFINIEKDCNKLVDYFQTSKGRLLGINMDSTIACANEFKGKGLDLKPELYEKGEKDFRTPLTKIKNDKPDFLVLRGLPTDIEIIFKQMKELDFPEITIVCPHISGSKCNSETIVRDYPDLLNRAIGTDFYFDLNNQDIRNFFEKYKSTFGREPTADAVYAYEDVVILNRAIKMCKSSAIIDECVKEKLLTETFEGLDGELKFDNSGIIERKTSILRFNGEQWVKL